MNTFKVGDIVKYKRGIPPFGLIGPFKITQIKPSGSICFNITDSVGYWPENFEIDKNSIVHDLLKDI